MDFGGLIFGPRILGGFAFSPVCSSSSLKIRSTPPPPHPRIYVSVFLAAPWKWQRHVGCVRLGNLDVHFKIRISYLQSNAKSDNGFNADISVFGFSFFFDWESEKGIEKLS